MSTLKNKRTPLLGLYFDEDQMSLLLKRRSDPRLLPHFNSPDNINYAAYGDKQEHYHMHIVPKKKDIPG
ncbi:hypothetical protein [Oceanispirochaeta sp.]|jgi:hypothetical protein|uniref:hypothetical protein n=1 Tax=Oceanispirochaeta sp. TaxID=2035350 RepID=UPI002619554E|nr:hypothetical protein [Oceanispirochaeta sp.]MDA3955109.1 hypothetical protein [Oceanispirochaeta sp.]